MFSSVSSFFQLHLKEGIPNLGKQENMSKISRKHMKHTSKLFTSFFSISSFTWHVEENFTSGMLLEAKEQSFFHFIMYLFSSLIILQCRIMLRTGSISKSVLNHLHSFPIHLFWTPFSAFIFPFPEVFPFPILWQEAVQQLG